MNKITVPAIAALLLIGGCRHAGSAVQPEYDASGFVLVSEALPDAILEIRYSGTFNFIGRAIRGYDEPIAALTSQAADSLRAVSDDLAEMGYRLKIYDAYRPQCAVDNFVEWASDPADTLMRQFFYPELMKDELIPKEYIASRSSHTRGSTVDLTLFDMRLQKDADMGCTFDYFGRASHPGLLPGEQAGDWGEITQEQYENRMILRNAMTAHGFIPYECEWWHFTLGDEPYPDTYFRFPLDSENFPRTKR